MFPSVIIFQQVIKLILILVNALKIYILNITTSLFLQCVLISFENITRLNDECIKRITS